MQALTLNLYGTNGNNFNSLIGYSLLTIDQMLSDTTVGERYGKQAFTSVNFKSKNSYGNFNIKPSATFEYGVTKLFEYTDFGTMHQIALILMKNIHLKLVVQLQDLLLMAQMFLRTRL